MMLAEESHVDVALIDNFDSFTHNLYQQLAMLGARVEVIRNDAIDVPGLVKLGPTHIVLSPGPGHPANPRDFGVCADVIRHFGPTTPLLGVCLGHQGIVHCLGGQIVRAPTIVHGKTSPIQHCGAGLFAGIPQNIEVMRYHSWIAERSSMPQCLDVTAETIDGLVMGVTHTSWPLVGVQFHPESIGTPTGHKLVENFLAMKSKT